MTNRHPLVVKLKSGEYDGKDIMEAWLLIESLTAEGSRLRTAAKNYITSGHQPAYRKELEAAMTSVSGSRTPLGKSTQELGECTGMGATADSSHATDYVTGTRIIFGRGDKRICAGRIEDVPAIFISDEGNGVIGEDLGTEPIPSGKEIVRMIFEDEAALDVLIEAAGRLKLMFTPADSSLWSLEKFADTLSDVYLGGESGWRESGLESLFQVIRAPADQRQERDK